MPSSVIGAIAGPVIGSAVGGLINQSSADDALQAQTQAADKAAAVQKEMFDTSRADLAPYRNTGYSANQKLSELMGLSPNRDTIANDIRSKMPYIFRTRTTNNNTQPVNTAPATSPITADNTYRNYKNGSPPNSYPWFMVNGAPDPGPNNPGPVYSSQTYKPQSTVKLSNGTTLSGDDIRMLVEAFKQGGFNGQ